MKDALGDRMKGHEAVTRHVLPRRTYTLIRLDGVSFHTYTRQAQCERPYDRRLMTAMQDTLQDLCQRLSGVALGYQQSDEITLVLTDFAKPTTDAWYGGVLQKIASVSAAMATREFNDSARQLGLPDNAIFDCRAFTVPDPVEVANAVLWRQKDAVRNSVSMCAQAQFSHRELQGKSTNEMLAMLDEIHTPWDQEDEGFKNGVWCVKNTRTDVVEYRDKRTGELRLSGPVDRSIWTVEPAPRFTADGAGPLMSRIPLYNVSSDAVLNRAR